MKENYLHRKCLVWCGITTEGITLCSQSDRSAFNNHAPYIQVGRPFIKYLYGEFIANVKDPISFFGQNQRKRRGVRKPRINSTLLGIFFKCKRKRQYRGLNVSYYWSDIYIVDYTFKSSW